MQFGAKRLSQPNRGRESSARFRRCIVCDHNPLEDDSVHRIRIELSRTLCINSPLSRPTLIASSDPRALPPGCSGAAPDLDRRLVITVITNAPHPIAITCQSSAMFRSTVRLSVCQLLARGQPFLGRGNENRRSSNVPACSRMPSGWPEQGIARRAWNGSLECTISCRWLISL